MDELATAHRHVAGVAGRLSLALTSRHASRHELTRLIAELERGAERLRAIVGDPQ